MFSSASDRTQNSLKLKKVFYVMTRKVSVSDNLFPHYNKVFACFYKLQTYLLCCNKNVSHYKMRPYCWSSRKFHVITKKGSCYNVTSLCDVILLSNRFSIRWDHVKYHTFHPGWVDRSVKASCSFPPRKRYLSTTSWSESLWTSEGSGWVKHPQNSHTDIILMIP